jgi:ABC-type amino acid transport system permease subunit
VQYHRLKNHFGCTQWYSSVTRLNSYLVSIRLEIVLALMQDRCMVCTHWRSYVYAWVFIGIPKILAKKLIHILVYVYMLLFNWTKRQKPTNKQLSGSRAGQQLTRPKRPPPIGNLTFIQNHESHELLLLVPSQGHWN